MWLPLQSLAVECSKTPASNVSQIWADWSLLVADSVRLVAIFNSLQTRCIVKGEAQKSPLFWRFSGGLNSDFLRIACSLGIPQENL